MKYGILLALALTLAPISTYAAGRGGGSNRLGMSGGSSRGLNTAPRNDRGGYRGDHDRGHSSYSFGFSYYNGGIGLGASYSHGAHYYRGSVYYDYYAPVYYTPRPIYVEPEPVIVAPAPVYYTSPSYYYYYSYPTISVGAYYYRR